MIARGRKKVHPAKVVEPVHDKAIEALDKEQLTLATVTNFYTDGRWCRCQVNITSLWRCEDESDEVFALRVFAFIHGLRRESCGMLARKTKKVEL